jgi:hypothetical protein
MFQIPKPLERNAMAEYRAYVIGADGHFIRAVELVCPDDDAAKECAKQLVDGHDIELWAGDRKVTAFKHRPE